MTVATVVLAVVVAALSLALVASVILARRRAAIDRAALARLTAENHALRERCDAAHATAELRARMVAHVSHELRTPMQAIMSLLALLDEHGLPLEQRRQHLSTLRGSTEDLLLLIDGLLDTAQIEGKRPSLRADDFSPRATLEQLVDLLGPSAHKRGLELRAALAPDLPPRLRGDRLRLRQIVINLIGNSIKFTRQGHVELRVAARVEDEVAHLQVEVSDTGVGMSPEALGRLFREFARVGDPSVEGTGLGLSISKQLVEALGGRLEVDSDPGVGTTFRFEVRMPLLAALPAEQAAAADNRPRVLVADDDSAGRELLATALRRSGYAVDGVADGAAAVASALARPYVAVILDVQLPELDGPDAARQIRDVRGDVALIALTGHTEIDVLGRCKGAGIDAILIKPVKLETLRATIVRVAAQRTQPVDLAVIRGYVTAEDPAFVPGLIDVYLREAERDLEAMEEAAAGQEIARVAQLAHRLKGSSAGFGARLLAERCQSLYAAARAEQPVSHELAALAREFGRVKSALSAERTRLISSSS
ncbi:ATP-binding protein [Nannocystis bainbridge]|uniref:histidine kinase n=1 Tax=Nannocystis bainbridge TaxID=2995303 RepID=A0ABT5DYT6_9BACT|nr:ATP-binding protein [Nannocystis bainbridge]MDC0718310.1 ATP-binding protein [Nannocystis bainbridge]